MTPRQHAIFRSTVREHIRTGSPIGSEALLERSRIPLSSATVRAELASLEDDGYLTHPHTSAGRVPTAAGYRYYVDHCVVRSPHPQASAQLGRLERAVSDTPEATFIRELAHILARLTGTLTVVALHERSVYEAGIGQLFRMRELVEDPAASDVERILDVIEDQPATVSALAEGGLTVLINGEIPFVRTRRVSMVVSSPALPSGQPLLAVLIGPLRMPYDRHIRVLEALDRALNRSTDA